MLQEKPTIHIPLEAVLVLETLHKAGFQGYIVGGAVRDLIRKSKNPDIIIVDYDFTTNAKPEEIMLLFPEGVYENTFGTVLIAEKHMRSQFGLPPKPTLPPPPVGNKVIDVAKATKIHISLRQQLQKIDERILEEIQEIPPYQITTFRSDGTYTDHRRPDSVQWGSTLEEDLARRDFTVNAMAISLSEDVFKVIHETDPVVVEPAHYTLQDPFGGSDALESNIISTVGEPTQRFSEDALRMLRAMRIAVQLNYAIDSQTYAAIPPLKDSLRHISGERIRDEFLKMLSSKQPKRAIEMLDETGLLPYVLPELEEGKDMQQGGHHTTNVWQHTLDTVQACPSTDPIVKLAALLHDIAKPRTFSIQKGQPAFYNHEVIGARMAKQIGQRLRLSNRDIQRLFILVRFHMFHYEPQNNDASVRRFMRQVGLENVDDILDVREGDRLGSGAAKTSWRLEEFKQRMIEQLHQPLDVTDLEIDGTDIMKELHIEPGPVIGHILHVLFEAVMEDPSLNERDLLLQKTKEILAENKK